MGISQIRLINRIDLTQSIFLAFERQALTLPTKKIPLQH